MQRCLTDNPILFGLDYQLVIPKQALGSEYEMDYALVRWNGQIDLVEIEASTHKLFTKKIKPDSLSNPCRTTSFRLAGVDRKKPCIC
ncbi:MAG: hypothetical protein H6657_21685 [Ardenticatenaceae bacterium]|nr:hypothetical protein [Ardenticatenaceae bacterium]